MKKLFILAIATLLASTSLWARPGYTKPVNVLQPDGTTVTLLMHGDEFLHFMTTTDGYTVVKGEDGYYCYAERLSDGTLKATATVAKDPTKRSETERKELAIRTKMLAPTMTKEQIEFKKQAATLYKAYPQTKVAGARGGIWDPIDYSKFKGLVVLVEFSDRKFTISDPVSFYQKLTSEKNYVDTSKEHYPVNVEGSVRDYFYDNSMGLFDPTFTVVGPVQVTQKCTDVRVNGSSNAAMNSIIRQALSSINAEVDFTEYDIDNNGYIDMVYFLFAGYGSYVQGNDSRYIWPHANDWSNSSPYYNMRYDGKYFGRYACSVEIQDYEAQKEYSMNFDGIGTMCHEFSHVLGLADHYDTDYETNGQAVDPGLWDIMANGADQNYGLTPVGYNAFERYILGFAEPEQLALFGNYKLESFATKNQAYIIPSETAYEDFYIENRQQEGWDRFLPGHGLLVWRVDTSNPSVWKNNKVNINPNNMNFELLSAAPSKDLYTKYAPFPGAANVIDLTCNTTPALLTSKGTEAAVDLYDITETEDGVITFNAGKDLYQSAVEDFEAMSTTTADAANIEGQFCNWTLNKATVEDVANNLGNGNHTVKMQRNGTIELTAIKHPVRKLSFKVWNGAGKARISLKYRENEEAQWTALTNSDGNTQETLAKNAEETTFVYNVNFPANGQLQLSMQSTVANAATYIDDFTISVDNRQSNDITSLHHTSTMHSQPYNLNGQRVSDNYKGLTIRNGKKYMVK